MQLELYQNLESVCYLTSINFYLPHNQLSGTYIPPPPDKANGNILPNYFFSTISNPSLLQYSGAILWRKSVMTITQGTILKFCFLRDNRADLVFHVCHFFIDLLTLMDYANGTFLVKYHKYAIFH